MDNRLDARGTVPSSVDGGVMALAGGGSCI